MKNIKRILVNVHRKLSAKFNKPEMYVNNKLVVLREEWIPNNKVVGNRI